MSFRRLAHGVFFTAIALCLTLFTQPSVQAQTITETGTITLSTSGSWADGTSWLSGSTPAASDSTAIVFGFNGQTGTVVVSDVPTDFVLNQMLVTTTTRNAQFNGGSFDFQGTLPKLMLDTVGNVSATVNSGITFNTDLMISVTGTNGSSLILRQGIATKSTGNATLTLGGNNVNSRTQIIGQISDGANGGTLSVFKTDAGLWTLSNANNTFSGGLTIESGWLRFINENSLGDAAGSITLGTAGTNLTASLSYTSAAAQTFTREIGIFGTTNRTFASEGAGAWTFNGPLTFLDADAKSIVLSSANLAAANDFQALITNNGAEATRLTKTGLGLWSVSNVANDFTGGVFIESGVLRVDDTAALNLAGNNLTFLSTTNTTTVGVLEGHGVFTAALGDLPGQVQWGADSGGGFSAFGGDLHVTLNGDAVTPIEFGGATSALRLSNTNELQLSSPVADSVTYIHNAFALSGNNRRINVDNNNNLHTDYAEMTGTLSGAGGIFKTNDGRLVLSGVNDFTGGITIHSGMLQAADVNQNLNLQNLTLRFNGASGGTGGVLQTAGTLNFLGLGAAAGQVEWLNNGSGGFAAAGGDLAVTLTTDTVTPLVWGTAPFIRGNGELILNSVDADGAVTFANSIDLAGGNRRIRVYDNDSLKTDYAVITGNIISSPTDAAGIITKTGDGLLVLQGTNTFTGGIRINGGTLRGLDPAVNLNMVDPVSGNNVTFTGVAALRPLLETQGSLTNSIGSGAGQIRWAPISSTGASGGFSAFGGALDVTLNNDAATPLIWNGTTDFLRNSSELQFGSIYSDNVVTFHNALDLNNLPRVIRVTDNPDSENDFTVMTGVLSSAGTTTGGLNVAGTGTLVLTAENSYTLTTTVTANSTLQLGMGGATGGVGGNINVHANGQLIFNHSTVYEMSNRILGAGKFVIDGPTTGGVLFTTTVQANTGGVEIRNGVLRYGRDNALGTTQALVEVNSTGTLDLNGFNATIPQLLDGIGGGGLITNGGAVLSTLTVSSTTLNSEFNGVIEDGLGGVAIIRAGAATTLTLGGTNTYSGGTTVSSGMLVATSDAALGVGLLRVNTNAVLSSGAGDRAYTAFLSLAGSPTFTGDGNVAFLGAGNILAGSTTAAFNNVGSTTIDGMLLAGSLTSVGTSAVTITGLAEVTGAFSLTNNSASVMTFNDVLLNNTFTFNASAGDLDIVGTLSATGGNRVFSMQSTNGSATLNNIAITAPGDDTQRTLTLTSVANSTLTINGAISDGGQPGGSLIFSGRGTYVLNGESSFSGLSTVTTGTSQRIFINADNALGTGTLNIALMTNGGIFNTDAAHTLANNLTLINTLTIGGDQELTLQGVLTNSGANRTLIVDNTAGLVLDGGVNLAEDTLASGGRILIISGSGGPVTINGPIANGEAATTGTLLVNNAGGVILNGENTFNGRVTINAGRSLTVGTGGTTGTLPKFVTNRGDLTINRSDEFVYDGVIQGSGDLIVDGPATGILTLEGANTYTGFTRILNGTVKYGRNNALLTSGGTVAINSTGTLDLAGFNAQLFNLIDGPNGGGSIVNSGAAKLLTLIQGDFSGVIGGGANIGILKNGSTGVLELSGANAFSALSTLNQGTLIVGNDAALGTGDWNVTGTLGILQSDGQLRVLANNFTLSGNATISGSSSLTFAGTVLNNLGNRSLTIDNSGVTTFEEIQVSEGATTSRTLTMFLGEQADVVIGNLTAGSNTGQLTINSIAGSLGGAQVLFNEAIDNTRTIAIAGVGHDVAIADGVSFRDAGVGVFAVSGGEHSFTLGPGATIGAMGLRSTATNSQFDIYGDFGSSGNTTATISLTGFGSHLTVYSGGSIGNGAIAMDNGTTLEIREGATAGNGAITTVGSATIILDGIKGTGNGVLDAGAVLIGSGVSSGTWTMTAGSSMFVGGVNEVGTLQLGRVILNGGTLNYDLGTLSDLLISDVTPSISGSSVINILDAGGFGVGDYTLINGYSGTIGNTQRFNVVLPAGYKNALVSTTGSLVLQVTAALTKTWDGALSDVWDDGFTANFSGQTYLDIDQDAVFFGDVTNTSMVTIANAGNGVAPTSVLVNNSAVTYTFAGEAITAGGFVKQGDGLVVILNNNTSPVPVQIEGGTVQLGDGGATGQFNPSNIIQMSNNSSLVVNRSDTLAIDGNISGTGSLVMDGSGVLQLSGTNTYFGGTTINAGTLEFTGNGRIPEYGGITQNGGALNFLTTVSQRMDNLTINGGDATVNKTGGSITLTEANVNGGTLTLIAGNVTSTTFNVDGGTVNLEGSNLLAPLLFNLQSGVVNLNNANLTLSVSRMGGATGSQSIFNVGAGMTLSIQNTLTFTAAGDGSFDAHGAIIQGDGVLSISSNKNFIVHDSVNDVNDLTISTTIANGGIIKSGAGRLYITGENLSTSPFSMNGGSTVIGSDTALGGATTITITSGTLLGDGPVRNIANDVNVRGTFGITGSSALTFAKLQYIGNIVTTFESSAKTVVTEIVAAEGNQARSQTFRGTGEVDMHLISAGTGTGADNVSFDSLEGTAIFNLLGANTYSGITSIRSGEVRVFNADAFQYSSAVRLGVGSAVTRTPRLLVNDGLNLANNLIVDATLTGNSPIVVGSLVGTAGFSGDITLFQDLQLHAPVGGTANFTGIISGTGGITATGGGFVSVSGVNTYSGVTAAEVGTLRAGSATAFGATSGFRVGSAGVIDLHGFNANAGTLSDGLGGGGSIVNTSAAAILTVNDGLFSGDINGPNLGLTKETAGVLELAGDNAYTGDTLVNAGTLNVTGFIASENVSVATDATLGGSGTIGPLAGTVSVATGGTLAGTLHIGGAVASFGSIAPSGTLTVGSLALNGGSLDLDLGAVGSSDRIVIAGGVAPTVNGPVTLNLMPGLEFDEGTYSLIGGYAGFTIDGGQFGNLSAPTTLSGLQTQLFNNDGSLELVVSTAHLTWDNGAATGLWNTTDLNWNDDVLATDGAFSSMAVVTFGDTAAGPVVVDAGGVTPHHVNVNATADYTFSGGAVIGTSLTKAGTGTLFLTNDNTYVRGVTINEGVVEVGDGTTNGSLIGDVVNNALLSFNRSDAYTFAGNISGTGSVIQNGDGTLIFTGDNTFTGITTLAGGMIEIQGNYASQIINAAPTTSLIEASGTDDITLTSSISGNVEFQQTGNGSTTLLGNNTYTGATVVDAGTLIVDNILNGTQSIDVNSDGSFVVTDGSILTTPGEIFVTGSAPVVDAGNVAGVFVADGTVNATQVTVETGGILQGSGTVNAPIFIESGAGLSPGNSVGELTFDDGVLSGGDLTLAGGSTLYFEFRDASGAVDFNGPDAGGTGAGYAWDLLDLGAGLLDISDASASNPVQIVVDAWHLDNSGHDDGTASTAIFDPQQSYEWLFIATTNPSSPAFNVPPDDDFARRFAFIDDIDGMGVFGTNNAFTRPVSSLGQGTFSVKFGDFGQGSGLYVTYSAIPEPGSMILAGLASLGAGWYGRRRLRRKQQETA